MSRYAVEITIHRAQHVPVGDLFHFSSDPYIWATLYPQNPTEGIPDSSLQGQVLEYRIHTVRSSLEPVFDCKWVVGGIPESGFALKLRLRDEDPGQFFRDDRLGKGVLLVPSPGEKLEEAWELRENECKIEKRKGAVRSHVSTYVARFISGGGIGHHTRVWVSVRVLGKSKVLEDDPHRIYTLGPRESAGYCMMAKTDMIPALRYFRSSFLALDWFRVAHVRLQRCSPFRATEEEADHHVLHRKPPPADWPSPDDS